MHPILLDFAKRFAKNPSKKLEISSFFTTLGEKYKTELPYLYDIDAAGERLILALKNDQKVCIYSDYDTDAVTATATMYWGLILLGFKPENLSFYAPDRFTEGYGMNTEAVAMLCDKYDLLISVDCGINSSSEAKVCQEKGVDLIITDHHHLSGDLPECLAVVNPRLSEYYTSESKKFVEKQNYLSSSVTGVGVAWFVVVWLAYKLKFEHGKLADFDFKELNQLLGFVAIGTIADCQSILDDSNRLLVKSGVKIIQSLSKQTSPNQILYGLWLLLNQSGISEQIQNGYNLVSSDLGFTLSPILNSSGRLSHASHSIQVMLAGNMDDKQSALDLVSGLIATNNQRKQEVSHILSQVETQAKTQFELGKKIIWVANSGWSKGLIGLLASRLVNQFNLPVVVVELPEESKEQSSKGKDVAASLTRHENGSKITKIPELEEAEITEVEGFATASLRAPEGYNLPVAMSEISELFVKFGGHPGAAGFSAKVENLPQIENSLEGALFVQKQNKSEVEKVDYSIRLDRETTPTAMPSPLERGTKNQKNQKLDTYRSKINSLWVSDQELSDSEFWASLLELEPFGQDFLYPVLVFPFVISKFDTLSQNLHLKFETNFEVNGGKIGLIWFNYAKSGFDLSQIEIGKTVWVIGRPQQNAWKNRLNWQILVEEMMV
jgi:single-stranded-DNA-specific exonuclease RecJ